MKSCREIDGLLPEYAAGRVVPSGEEIAAHLSRCAGCAAAERELRAVFAALAAASEPPEAAEGAARARAALEAAASAPAAIHPARRLRPVAVRLAAGATLAIALLAVVLRQGSQPVGAAVEAAIQRANTWHLVGWKLMGGRRVPWEIWGRRSPFFYREQLGDALNFDDGTQRTRVVPTGPNGKLFALRLESGPAPSDEWREWMTMGQAWRSSKPWRVTPDALVWRGHSSGMGGPWTAGDQYVTVDRQSWLPTRYEYRMYRTDAKAPAWVVETLQARYNVPLPAQVTRLHLPPDAVVADTLSAPTNPSIPTRDVQRAHGLTVQVTALAMDPRGDILVRVRSWLGNLKLGAEGTPTWNGIGTDVRYRTFGQTRDTAFHADDGSACVEFAWPRVPLDLANGDVLKLLAPLEPRPTGTPPPRALSLDLDIAPQVVNQDDSRDASTVLFHQGFVWTLPLPAKVVPIHIDDYLPPGHRQRFHYAPGADDSTVESNIDFARAGQYEIENDFGRSIYWEKQGLAVVGPFTNTAQFRRLDLAHIYQEAGDFQQAAHWDREVIAISKQHPETWSYYAWQAKGGLRYMATHKLRRWAQEMPARGNGPRS